MLPPPPWLPVHGAVDAVVSERARHHIAGEAIAGRPAFASGWLLDSRNPEALRPVEAAWLVVGDDEVHPLILDRTRPDVIDTLKFGDSAAEIACGFLCEVPLAAVSGRRRCRVVARASDGTGLVGNHEAEMLTALAPLDEPPARDDRALDADASLVLRDTVSTSWTFDRGPHSIRAAGSMVVSGHAAVDGPRMLRIAGAGHERWFTLEPGTLGPHRFRSVLSLEDCPIAGYEATVYVGSPARPVLTTLFELADEHLFLPEALARFRQPPAACSLDLVSAEVLPPYGSRALTNGRIERGIPLWISGSALDPANDRPLLSIYAQVDDRRPIPIPHWVREGGGTAFGGIVDTARLVGGPHRVELLAISSLGNGVYSVGSRAFEVLDSKRYAPIAVPLDATSTSG